MELKQEHMREAVASKLFRGEQIPAFPTGPVLQEFSPLMMAQAIEAEIRRGGELGWDRMSIHITMDDAYKLAAYLRLRG